MYFERTEFNFKNNLKKYSVPIFLHIWLRKSRIQLIVFKPSKNLNISGSQYQPVLILYVRVPCVKNTEILGYQILMLYCTVYNMYISTSPLKYTQGRCADQQRFDFKTHSNPFDELPILKHSSIFFYCSSGLLF